MYNKPDDIPIISWIVVFITTLFIGFLSFYNRLVKATLNNKKYSFKQKMVLFLFDIFSSAGIGTISFIALVGNPWFHITDNLAIGISAALGHIGTRAIYIIPLYFVDKESFKEILKKEAER